MMEDRMKHFIKACFILLGGVALFVGVVIFAGWVTALVWNWLMPVIFGLPKITFVQGIGLQILSALLIKSNYTYSKNKKKG